MYSAAALQHIRDSASLFTRTFYPFAITKALFRRVNKIMFKPKDDVKNAVSDKAIQQIESRKANLSTKFSSSKLLKENDFAFSQKNLGKFEGIEEVPESSYNSSINSNAFNWRNKRFNSGQSYNKKGKRQQIHGGTA